MGCVMDCSVSMTSGVGAWRQFIDMVDLVVTVASVAYEERCLDFKSRRSLGRIHLGRRVPEVEDLLVEITGGDDGRG